jgi:hypothetical protein
VLSSYDEMTTEQKKHFGVACPEHQPQFFVGALYFVAFRMIAASIVLKLIVGTIIVRALARKVLSRTLSFLLLWLINSALVGVTVNNAK